jgi:putative hydrolase of the HAD superfamily
MLQDFKAIFFDAGGTLFHPYPSVGEIYVEVARRYGCHAQPAEIEKIFRSVWRHKDEAASLVSHSSEKIEKQWWYHLVFEVFSHVGGVPDFDRFFDELYHIFAAPAVWRVYPGTEEILERLSKDHKRLAIVSNWDSRLFGLVSGLGLDRYFEFVLASAVVGFSKPSPKIFEEALRKMNVLPQEAVHIGDSLEDDIKGAANAGIRAVLIDRHADDPGALRQTPENVAVIRDFKELF